MDPGAAHDGEGAMPPRSDLLDAALWLLLGGAVLAGAWRMDRLENQDVPVFGAPGLLPGLLGVLLLVFGGILLTRSVQRGGLRPRGERRNLLGAAPGRALWVIGLCVLFGGGLVGRGLPFWAASTVFVTVAILSLRLGPDGRRRRIDPAAVLAAAATGLAAGLGIMLVFQQIFLVRLP
jgi:hypothetical protein